MMAYGEIWARYVRFPKLGMRLIMAYLAGTYIHLDFPNLINSGIQLSTQPVFDKPFQPDISTLSAILLIFAHAISTASISMTLSSTPIAAPNSRTSSANGPSVP